MTRSAEDSTATREAARTGPIARLRAWLRDYTSGRTLDAEQAKREREQRLESVEQKLVDEWASLEAGMAQYEDAGDPFHLPAEARARLLAKMSGLVDRYGQHTAAVFALEVTRPLSFFVGQGLLFGSFATVPIFGQVRMRNIENFFNDRRNVEMLIRCIEADARKESDAKTEAKKKRKAERAARKIARNASETESA